MRAKSRCVTLALAFLVAALAGGVVHAAPVANTGGGIRVTHETDVRRSPLIERGTAIVYIGDERPHLEVVSP
ncbi:MAG: hypothetical protein FJZ90_06800 [Chloroflexi bacterium]|nr:hypothetical protein [Chloroflexota bacterium]